MGSQTQNGATALANQTMLRFGYPQSLIAEAEHWVVLLRPEQVTAGCLVLACKEDALSLGQISAAAGAELPKVAAALEAAVRAAYGPEKFNYLALMMVDPQVHFHVIPRYAQAVDVAGTRIPDSGWPKFPDLGAAAPLTGDHMAQIQKDLKAKWPG